MMKKILYRSLIIILMLISIFILPIFYPRGIAVFVRLFLLCLILIESLKLFKIIFIDKNVNKIILNAATVLLSVFILFILLEAVFMFVPRSHSIDYTLASKLWYAKYWKPINSLGFRDKEPESQKPVILFVGDSFTAGHGLKSVDDRFSDIAGKALKKKFSVINIAKPNLDSKAEFEVMENFIYMTRIKPDKIVLQYCGNDIEGAAAANGLIFEGFHPPPDMNKVVMFLGSGSYILNYIYFLFPREHMGMPSYISYLTKVYKNDKVLSMHKDDLALFINYAKKNSIQLIVVVFPFLTDIETSDSMYVNDIVNYFEDNKVSIINVSLLIKEIPIHERIVNRNDSHPSVKLNRIVAQEILNKL
jgi:hypothetical protein